MYGHPDDVIAARRDHRQVRRWYMTNNRPSRDALNHTTAKATVRLLQLLLQPLHQAFCFAYSRKQFPRLVIAAPANDGVVHLALVCWLYGEGCTQVVTGDDTPSCTETHQVALLASCRLQSHLRLLRGPHCLMTTQLQSTSAAARQLTCTSCSPTAAVRQAARVQSWYVDTQQQHRPCD